MKIVSTARLDRCMFYSVVGNFDERRIFFLLYATGFSSDGICFAFCFPWIQLSFRANCGIILFGCVPALFNFKHIVFVLYRAYEKE